jgi:hypothetical protein
MPDVNLAIRGVAGWVHLSLIQMFLLDAERHRLVVLRGSTAHYKPKLLYGVTHLEVAKPEDWAKLESGPETYYGIATGFTLEELELGGIAREL